MSCRRYMLDGEKAVPCDDLLAWARWIETEDCRVAMDHVGDVRVSTVFLGLDHNFAPGGVPVLFETMVFGGPLHHEMERYTNWEQAEAGHAAMVERVRASAAPPRAVLWILISGGHYWQAAKFVFGHYILREPFTIEEAKKTEVEL